MKKWLLYSSMIVLLSIASYWIFSVSQKPSLKAVLENNTEETIVSSNKVWELDFSTKMDEETVTNDNIYVKNERGEVIPVSLALSEDKKHVKVSPPKDGYDPDAAYTLHVTDNIQSLTGEKIREGTEITFKVIPELPTFSSKEELNQYFLTVLKQKEKNSFFPSIEEETLEFSNADKAEDSSNGYSETNNQVEGVDEADTVKTDGNYIYQLTNRSLVITDTSDPSNLSIASTIAFDDTTSPRELFLYDETLIIIGESWNLKNNKAIDRSIPVDYPPFHGSMNAYIYDVSDQSNPELIREIGLEGNYVTARKVDSYVYLVANHYPNYRTLEYDKDNDLRPQFYDSVQGKKMTPINYDEIKFLPESYEANYTILTAIDVTSPKTEVFIEAYLGGGQQIYMSQENLYIAASKYAKKTEIDKQWPSPNTEIYKFSVNKTNIDFVSLAEVNGTILNQFSMDEHDGYFRVATTKHSSTGVFDDEQSTNNLYILNENMKHVGAVEDLAKGERIYSVRFMGKKAYVVTFKQVDPLFVIDVAEPTAPEVLGELKIPGFSTYLHPYDEKHIIGFGHDTTLIYDEKNPSVEPRVQTGGMKISLFDITNFENPKEIATEIIGDTGTYSNLLYDHKALLHHKEKDLFAFPISVYLNKEVTSIEEGLDFKGALVYEISPEKGITQKASLSLIGQQLDGKSEKDYGGYRENEIQRLLYIQNDLYALSNRQIGVYDLTTWKEKDLLTIK
ncbi:beta-propeller domain-containing protein [Bacillus spongiae]|uniref:Beta-propeller domain-containing protein n=1 Tax=Bacillus spongiae TaxID=2683610 RepID=A0ABU8HEH6_9BACI